MSLHALPIELLDVLRGYAALVPPASLKFPAHLDFEQVHGFFLTDILSNTHLTTYPASKQYQSSFWKWAVEGLESMIDNEDTEINEQIYEHYISLLPQCALPQAGAVKPPKPSFVTYMWRYHSVYETATLMESRTLIEGGTTGLKTWLASLLLAEYLVSHSGLVEQKHVLELGSGAGFLGIVIATVQAQIERARVERKSSLYLTDVNEDVLRRCQYNISLPCNKSSCHQSLQCLPLDWTDSLDPLRRPRLQDSLNDMDVDVIVAADVVYHPSIIPALVEVLHMALKPRPQRRPKAFIALTIRNEDTVAEFLRAAGRVLAIEEAPQERCDQGAFVDLLEGQLSASPVKIFQLMYSSAISSDC